MYGQQYSVTATGLIKMTAKQVKEADYETLVMVYSRGIAFGGLSQTTANRIAKEIKKRQG